MNSSIVLLFEAPSEISQFERIGLSAVTAKFLWNEIECRKWNGVASGYAFQLLMQRQDTETVVRQSIINDTELELRNLVPYTNYSIELWSVNHRFPGPKTRIDFMTYEGGQYSASSVHWNNLFNKWPSDFCIVYVCLGFKLTNFVWIISTQIKKLLRVYSFCFTFKSCSGKF